MQAADDSRMLREYVENHSDEAFAALVARHINMVYTVALRCTGDSHQAEDLAQAVFVLLAKKAAQLRHDKALSSWLFQTTRLTASNFVRSETRRHRREQEAHMQSVLNDSQNDIWPSIAPLLDDAVAGLREKDRQAIILRFYEGKNLREVSTALGASEDAAEKRISRAVERLREFFARRGVIVGASGLVIIISANAVQAAPVGLALAVSTAVAFTTTSVVTTATATKAIAVTTLQKTLIAATLVVAVGTAIYEAHQASALRVGLATWRQQSEQLQQLTNERDDALNASSASREELERLRQNQNELIRLRGEFGMLRQRTNELGKLLEENRRLRPSSPPETITPEQVSELAVHKQYCAEAWMQAFRAYAKNNQGNLPGSFEQAEPYWPKKIGKWSDVSTDQFEILYQGSLDALPNLEVIVFREKKLWQHVNGRWGRFDVLANGSAQYGSVPDGSRDEYVSDFEREHMVTVVGQ